MQVGKIMADKNYKSSNPTITKFSNSENIFAFKPQGMIAGDRCSLSLSADILLTIVCPCNASLSS